MTLFSTALSLFYMLEMAKIYGQHQHLDLWTTHSNNVFNIFSLSA